LWQDAIPVQFNVVNRSGTDIGIAETDRPGERPNNLTILQT